MDMQEKNKRRFSVFSVFFTFFIDNLGFTIIFPILAPLFLSPTESILSASMSYKLKATILGLFLGVYPFAQFLCAPLIGEFADKYGRKFAFISTGFITLFGYILCAVSITYKWVLVLFFARLIMGASSGSLSVCLSSLADLSDSKKTKIRYYGLGSVIAGVTFVLGPFLGGKLSDPALNDMFSPAFPMWAGGMLTFVNLIFLFFAFTETVHKKSGEKFDLIKGFHNVQIALRTPSIKKLYMIYFFYLLSWNMLFQFIPAFLVTRFSSGNSMIGDISALMGGCWIIGSVLLYKGLLPFVKTKTMLFITSVLLIGLILACSFVGEMFYFVIFLGISVVVASFGWPLCAGAISNAASNNMQGKIFGLSQSIQSLAMMLAPIIVAPFLAKGSGIPFYIAAAVSAVFGILVIFTKVPEHH